jgi:hypothetical protein
MLPDFINGYRVMANSLLPEFKPKLEMRPCGCSLKVLDDMNAYLLKMFGGERHFLVMEKEGLIFAHPNNVLWLSKQWGVK